MISTQSGLRLETPFESYHPSPTIMTYTNTLQQLQTHSAEKELHHQDEPWKDASMEEKKERGGSTKLKD